MHSSDRTSRDDTPTPHHTQTHTDTSTHNHTHTTSSHIHTQHAVAPAKSTPATQRSKRSTTSTCVRTLQVEPSCVRSRPWPTHDDNHATATRASAHASNTARTCLGLFPTSALKGWQPRRDSPKQSATEYKHTPCSLTCGRYTFGRPPRVWQKKQRPQARLHGGGWPRRNPNEPPA